jgi:hypothetical protein
MTDETTTTDERDPKEPVVRHTESRGPNKTEGAQPHAPNLEAAPDVAVEDDDAPVSAAATVPTGSEGEER